jgi:hypothetical protein
MFDELVSKILENHNVFPRAKAPMTSGPNVAGPGPLPTGFLGGGLPGINPNPGPTILLKKRKKKKVTRKRSQP